MKESSWFWAPVRPEDAPGYSEVVTRAMDLATASDRLKLPAGTPGAYASAAEFLADVQLVWDNCLQVRGAAWRLWECGSGGRTAVSRLTQQLALYVPLLTAASFARLYCLACLQYNGPEHVVTKDAEAARRHFENTWQASGLTLDGKLAAASGQQEEAAPPPRKAATAEGMQQMQRQRPAAPTAGRGGWQQAETQQPPQQEQAYHQAPHQQLYQQQQMGGGQQQAYAGYQRQQEVQVQVAPVQRQGSLQQILQNIAPENQQQVQQLLQTLPADQQHHVQEMLARLAPSQQQQQQAQAPQQQQAYHHQQQVYGQPQQGYGQPRQHQHQQPQQQQGYYQQQQQHQQHQQQAYYAQQQGAPQPGAGWQQQAQVQAAAPQVAAWHAPARQLLETVAAMPQCAPFLHPQPPVSQGYGCPAGCIVPLQAILAFPLPRPSHLH